MEQQRNLITLEDIHIASPCRADWHKMQGDDRVRFCQTCAKNVYNLSAMSRSEAEELIREKEGNLCARLYRREDGTILTDNCPVGLKIVRRPFKWLAAGFIALLTLGGTFVRGGNAHSLSAYPDDANSSITAPQRRLRDIQPFKLLYDWVDPEENRFHGGGVELRT